MLLSAAKKLGLYFPLVGLNTVISHRKRNPNLLRMRSLNEEQFQLFLLIQPGLAGGGSVDVFLSNHLWILHLVCLVVLKLLGF